MPLLTKDLKTVVNAIKLPEDCISIISINQNGNYDIKISVLMDLEKIISNKTFKVNFKVSQSKESLFSSELKKVYDSEDIIRIQQLKIDFINGVYKENYILQQELDLTTTINNLNVNGSLKEITPNLGYKKFSNFSVNSKINFQSDAEQFKNEYLQTENLASVLKSQNKDPLSKLTNIPFISLLESTKSIDGNISDVPSLSVQELHYINAYKQTFSNLDLVADDLIPTINSNLSSVSKFEKIISVNPNGFDTNKLQISADLIDINGQTVQTEEITINFQKILQLFKSINDAPLIKISKASFPPNFLAVEVRSKSNSLDKCDLYLRNEDQGNYQNQKITLNNGSFYFKLPMIKSNLNIKTNYSSIEGKSNQGFKFSSSTFSNPRQKTLVGFVTATQAKKDIFVSARNLHPLTTGVTFYVIDKTLKSNPRKINASTVTNGVVTQTAIHVNPFPRHVYEYYCVSQLSDGTHVKSKSDIIECFSFYDCGIELGYNNLSITTNDVSFSVNLKNIDTVTDKIFNFVRLRGLESYFTGDFSNQISSIKKLLSYHVHRVNVSKGNRDYLGFFVDGESFSDSSAVSLQGATQRLQTENYIYQIFVTLTDSSTLFDNQTNQVFSDDKMQSYSFNSQKFKNSFTRLNSTLITPRGIKKKIPGTLFSHDVIASINIIVPSANNLSSNLGQIKIDRVYNDGKTLLSLKWSSFNSPNIDYFLLSKVVSGRFNFIGRCINLSRGSEYVDVVDQYGNIHYFITPVYYNGTFGTPLSTSIVVNPPMEQVI